MQKLTALQAFWGPLSFLMVYYIVTSHPFRYPLQAIVSLGQIYGDILYYATCLFDHYHKSLTYCRPEAYYFWFYFFFMNFIWIIIPGCKWTCANCAKPVLICPQHYSMIAFELQARHSRHWIECQSRSNPTGLLQNPRQTATLNMHDWRHGEAGLK